MHSYLSFVYLPLYLIDVVTDYALIVEILFKL